MPSVHRVGSHASSVHSIRSEMYSSALFLLLWTMSNAANFLIVDIFFCFSGAVAAYRCSGRFLPILSLLGQHELFAPAWVLLSTPSGKHVPLYPLMNQVPKLTGRGGRDVNILGVIVGGLSRLW